MDVREAALCPRETPLRLHRAELRVREPLLFSFSAPLFLESACLYLYETFPHVPTYPFQN